MNTYNTEISHWAFGSLWRCKFCSIRKQMLISSISMKMQWLLKTNGKERKRKNQPVLPNLNKNPYKRHQLTTHSHQEISLTYHLASNICLPFHLCYSKAFLQLYQCHSHHQGISCNNWLPESDIVNSCEEEVFTGTSHFRLQHDYATNLRHCLGRTAIHIITTCAKYK